MDMLLSRANAASAEQLEEMISECVAAREDDDARRRGTRTRGLTQKETRRWSGR
jgi:hypothetical protein